MRNLIFGLFLLPTGLATAQLKPLDAATIHRIKEGVSRAAINTRSITCDFTQEKEMTILKDKIITTGKFYFQKEQQLRWEYVHPFRYVIVIRGEVITIRDEGEIRSFHTQSNKIFAEVNHIILGSVRGTLLEDDGFATVYAQNEGNYIVRLSPRSPQLKENLKEIVIFFHKGNFTVDRLEMIEPNGDFTRITFHKKRINESLPDEIFILD